MNAQQYISDLSDKTGISNAELTQVDRVLANAGLRQRASGRNYPEITLVEAIRLPLAYMAARVTSRAATDVVDVSNFVPHFGGIRVEFGEYIDGLSQYGFGKYFNGLKNFDDLTLIEALEILAVQTARPMSDAGDGNYFWIEVERSGTVNLQFDGRLFKGEICFSGVRDHVTETGFFKQASTLHGRVLSWIGHITKDVAA